MHSAAEPFQQIVDESLDEATFLWRVWERELTSPTRNLDEVWSWTEDRLHGALDGVLVAGAGAIDVAAAGLLSNEPARVAASAGVLASSADQRATDALAAALGAAEDEPLRAMVRGLELLGSDQALNAAASVLTGRRSVDAGALCRLKAFHRVPPGDEMLTALRSGIPDIQVDALRAALLVPSRRAGEWIAAALRDRHAMVQYAAVEGAVSLGVDDGWETAVYLARKVDADAGRYFKLLAMLGTPYEHAIVYSALRIPELQLPAIWALGHIGTVRAAEACLAGMLYETLARACGEAYCWITGADLARDDLAADEPSVEVPPFEDDDLDANLVPPPEALWPLPDPDRARQHWLARSSQFVPDVRYIHGRPATPETVSAMIETGPMLRRPDLVLELRARTQGRYDVETRAFRWRQRQMMARGRAALSTLDGR